MSSHFCKECASDLYSWPPQFGKIRFYRFHFVCVREILLVTHQSWQVPTKLTASPHSETRSINISTQETCFGFWAIVIWSSTSFLKMSQFNEGIFSHASDHWNLPKRNFTWKSYMNKWLCHFEQLLVSMTDGQLPFLSSYWQLFSKAYFSFSSVFSFLQVL